MIRSADRSKTAAWPIILVIAALYFAREICIPIALSILFTFLLSPVVMRLRRWGWGKLPAVVTVVAMAFLLMTVIGWLVTMQLLDLTRKLPEYRDNIQTKIALLTRSTGGKLSQLIDIVEAESLNNLSEGHTNGAPKTGQHLSKNPIPVEIHERPTTPIKLAQGLLGNLFRPLATIGIVVVFVVFMLFHREDLRNRILHLLGSGKLKMSTQALDEAGQRVSRYLLMQLLINASYGVLIGIGLYFIGIPNALVCGLLATFLRFIPYVGPVMSAVVPLGLAFAVDPGWLKPILTVALFVPSEMIIGNVIEPWLYGTSTGISSFAVIVAAVVWAWLWGPVGLLLATPLTVCLAVLGRYVPQLGFLHVILSDEPVLADEARFYQRLLANDPEEAAEVAEEILKSQPLEFLFDKVIIPALSLAEHDRNEGILDAQRFKFILDSTKEIVAELTLPDSEAATTGAAENEASPIAVLCIPAKDEADEVCGTMLVHLLRKNNVIAMCVSASSLANERFQEVKRLAVPVVCVSALPPSALRQARLFCKRLRAECPDSTIVLGVWTRTPDLEHIRSRLPSEIVNQIVTNLSDAVGIIQPIAAKSDNNAVPTVFAQEESVTGQHL